MNEIHHLTTILYIEKFGVFVMIFLVYFPSKFSTIEILESIYPMYIRCVFLFKWTRCVQPLGRCKVGPSLAAPTPNGRRFDARVGQPHILVHEESAPAGQSCPARHREPTAHLNITALRTFL